MVKADIVCPIDLAGLFFEPANIPAVVVPLIHGTVTSEVPLDWRYRRHQGVVGKLKAAWRYKTRLALLLPFKAMVRRMDSIIVDSKFTRRELMLEVNEGASTYAAGTSATLVANKISVVPLGLDMERYQETSPVERGARGVGASTLRIAMLGRLQEIKGIGNALHAAAALKARGVDFQLSIGGTGEYEAAAQKLIEELDLQQQVQLEGRIEPMVLSSWLSSHDLFLFPDLTQPAFGLVALEAMRYGLPVVAANVGALPEVVIESCGWLYSPWDINGLAGLLMHLADNPDEIRLKAACARARIEDFTAEKMTLRTEQVFLEVSSRR
jgi:glycosyltransferase involved in cell wall biosynthesis